MKKTIIGITPFSISTITHAADAAIYGEITSILNYEGHNGTLIYMAEPMAPSAGFCRRNDYYILPLNHMYYSQNYSLLLGAKLAGKKVTLILTTGACVDDMPKIQHVRID